jgi:hypothetical protein
MRPAIGAPVGALSMWRIQAEIALGRISRDNRNVVPIINDNTLVVECSP